MSERGWFTRRVFPTGGEPDPRFTLANERTFLAWIRTALGLLAGGIALGTGRGDHMSVLREGDEAGAQHHWVMLLSHEGLSTPVVFARFDELAAAAGRAPERPPLPPPATAVAMPAPSPASASMPCSARRAAKASLRRA